MVKGNSIYVVKSHISHIIMHVVQYIELHTWDVKSHIKITMGVEMLIWKTDFIKTLPTTT